MKVKHRVLGVVIPPTYVHSYLTGHPQLGCQRVQRSTGLVEVVRPV